MTLLVKLRDLAQRTAEPEAARLIAEAASHAEDLTRERDKLRDALGAIREQVEMVQEKWPDRIADAFRRDSCRRIVAICEAMGVRS
jgi:hypothetical protein